MLPDKKTDEYTRYCITPEGKEYLRRMLENTSEETEDNDDEFELNMDEEIDFENLKIFDIDDDDFEPDELDILENEILNDEQVGELFRLNEKDNDDDYDFWKETQS
jgi:DNA-binding PadR family transcriptional regulator